MAKRKPAVKKKVPQSKKAAPAKRTAGKAPARKAAKKQPGRPPAAKRRGDLSGRIADLEAEVDRLRSELAMPARAIDQGDLLRLAQERISVLEQQVAPPEDGKLRCPRCQGSMVEYQHDVVRADRCEACGGIFFDRGELESVLEAHDKALAGEPKPDQGGLLGLMKAMLGR